MPIKSLASDLQPREKALNFGIDKLSDVELLALIIQSGTRKLDAIEISKKLLEDNCGLNNLSKTKLIDLYSTGVKKAKGLKLLACFEIARRLEEKKAKFNEKLENITDLYMTFGKNIAYLKDETLVVVLLDSHKRLLRYKKLSSSEENMTEASIKKLLQFCLLYESKYVYLLHNHPSTNLNPSIEDIQSTLAFSSSLKVVDIQLLDHLIVSDKGYYSFKKDETILIN